MASKIDRLHTPKAYKDIEKAYQELTILEVAAIFRTSHETIRKILIKNGIRIRKCGEHTDSTKVHSAAYSAVNLIRKYPERLHPRILKQISDFL